MSDAPTMEELESVSDTMRSVMEDSGVTPTDPLFDTVQETLETSEVVEAPKEERPRDEQGRFVSREQPDEEAPAEEPQEAAEEAVEEVVEEPSEEPSKEPSEEVTQLEPNPEWSAEEHELFYGMDRKAQEFILDKFNKANEQATNLQSEMSKWSEFDRLLADNRVAWNAKGLDDLSAVRALIQLSVSAEGNPAEFIKWFAQGRGVNLADLIDAPPDMGDSTDLDPYADPQVNELKRQNQMLEQEMNQIKQYLTQRQQEQQTVVEQDVTGEITAFRDAVGDNGQKLHPYFSQVEDTMADLITSAHARGKEMTLEQAYTSACRIDDDISAKIEASRKARETQDQAAKRRNKSMAATRAGSSVSGKPTPSDQHTGDSIADQLKTEFETRGLLDQPLV